MNPMSPKVTVGAATASGSVGPSLFVIWLLGLFHITVPPEIAAVIASELAAAVGLFFGWLTPHAAGADAAIAELRAQMAEIIARLPPAANANPPQAAAA